jgi:hypothetical protein
MITIHRRYGGVSRAYLGEIPLRSVHGAGLSVYQLGQSELGKDREGDAPSWRVK